MDLSGIGKSIGRFQGAQIKARPEADPSTREAADESDHLELSDPAESVLSQLENLKPLAAASPPIREERVHEVRERIASGDYNRPAVRKAVASKLAEAILGLLPRLA